jgi:hypothetical protein
MPEELPLPGHLGAALEVARTRGQGQVQAAKKIGKARKKRGLFQTVGMIGGAIGGFMLGGPAGASAGAAAGGSLGGGLSGVSANIQTPEQAQSAQTTQQTLSLGGQLASFGFAAPPATNMPDLGSKAINPFALDPAQSSLRSGIFGGGGANG